MTPNIVTTLDRAEELLKDLLEEYETCLRSKSVSDRAIQLTHDVCEKLRSVLDRVARRYWEIHISPAIAEADRKDALIYFPIAKDVRSLDSFLGRWRWKAVRAQHQDLYDYLLAQQPFTSPKNQWLAVVSDIANKGKHIDLVPQKRTEERRTTVTKEGGGSVSWGQDSLEFGPGGSVEFGPGGQIVFGPGGVRFTGNISVVGAPIDTGSQQIVPTLGVTQKIETWVSFLLGEHGVNATGLCKEACAGTRRIAVEMSDKFGLS